MLHTGTPEDRIFLDTEERKKILKDNYGVCARCGKKLDVNTMTVEHIIPRSRGGKNEHENYCCLCRECNKEKDSIFFIPSGWYHAIRNMPRYDRMCGYVLDWYHALPEDQKGDLKRFPLITPRTGIAIDLGNPMGLGGFAGHKKRRVSYSSQLHLEWQLVGNQNRDEVEAVTGCYVRELRSHVNEGIAEDGWFEAEAGVYILKKRSDDRLLALAAIRYFEELKMFRIYIPWADMSKTFLRQAVTVLADMAVTSIVDYAEKPVNEFTVESPVPHALDGFTKVRYMDLHTGRSWRPMEKGPNREPTMIEVHRTEDGRSTMETVTENFKRHSKETTEP